MRNMEDILKLVCKYLNDHNIEYAIIGGVAVIAFGIPRTTMDADYIINMEIEGMKRLAEFLAENGFYSAPLEIEMAVHERSHFTAIEKSSLIRLDIKGVYESSDRRTLHNRRVIEYKGSKMYFASPEDTIAHKLLYGSEQDVKDAEGIYARQLPNLDTGYLEGISEEMGVAEDLALIQKRIEEYSCEESADMEKKI